MKIALFSFFLLISALAPELYSQMPATTDTDPVREYALRKQILVDRTDIDIAAIPYAAVRVHTRFAVAAWLWRRGADNSNRAEDLAVKAIEELYDKELEIPDISALEKELWPLLESYAPETAERLKKKYSAEMEGGLKDAVEGIDAEGGDIIAIRKLRRSLAETETFDEDIIPLLAGLRRMRSPQYFSAVALVITSLETNRVKIDAETLEQLSPELTAPIVPQPILRRYFVLVMNMARAAINRPGLYIRTYISLLRVANFRFGDMFPDLESDAGNLIDALRVSLMVYENRLRAAEKRISESSDKLAAVIAEAEAADTGTLKSSFYHRAIGLAVTAQKYERAVDLIKTLRLFNLTPSEELIRWTDSQLAQISSKAVLNDEATVALKARNLILDDVERADSWGEAAQLFSKRKEKFEAENALYESIKILSKAPEEDPDRAVSAIRLIITAQSVDKNRLSEIILLTARAIKELPALDIDERAGSKKYENYVRTIMQINRNLRYATIVLLDKNKGAAADLAGRVQRKEIKVLADFLIESDRLESVQRVIEPRSRPD